MKTFLRLLTVCIAILFGVLLFVGCEKDESITPMDTQSRFITPTSGTGLFYGLSPTNQLYKFGLTPAYQDLGVVSIKGLKPGEQILAIDVRPVNRALYGVSNMNRIVMIDRMTGYIRGLGTTGFTPAIEGNTVAFEFNAITGMIMLMTDKGMILTLHPITGQVINKKDGTLSGINSLANSGTEMFGVSALDGFLYGIDANGNVKQIGSTGLTMTGEGGLDFRKGFTIGVFYASGVVPDATHVSDDLTQQTFRLYSINTSTGQAVSLGQVKPMIGVAGQ